MTRARVFCNELVTITCSDGQSRTADPIRRRPHSSRCPPNLVLTMSSSLRVAVCLFPDVTALDFQGPMELFGLLSAKWLQIFGSRFKTLPSTTLETTYLSHDLEPVAPISGPLLQPSATYDVEEQFDIILVPGGLRSGISFQGK